MLTRFSLFTLAAGATDDVTIDAYVPVAINDPALTARMLPMLQTVAVPAHVHELKAQPSAEDFYQERVPGLFFFVTAWLKGNTRLPPRTIIPPVFTSIKAVSRWA